MEPEAKKQCLEGDSAPLQISTDEVTLCFLTGDYVNENVINDNENVLNDIREMPQMQTLYTRYAEVLEKVKPASDPINAYKMLNKDEGGKSPEYNQLNKTITALVKTIGMDDPHDFRIGDVVLLVSEMFSALRQHKHEHNVHNKILRRVKAAVHANRQRSKDQFAFGNIEDHLKDLYDLYPEVKALAFGRWPSSAERPYRDTVLEIVQAIGIEDANDTRIAHAVTLAMDQYSVLRDQITNHNLRKQFLSRIKRAFSDKPKKKVKRLSNGTLSESESESSHSKEPRLCRQYKENKPVVIELVIEQDEKLPEYTGNTHKLLDAVTVVNLSESVNSIVQNCFHVDLEKFKSEEYS